jgi:hypothetical protein
MGIIKETFIDDLTRRAAETNHYIAQDIKILYALDQKVQTLLDQGERVSEIEKGVAAKWIEAVNIEMWGKFPSKYDGRGVQATKMFFKDSLSDEEKKTTVYKLLCCSQGQVYRQGMDVCKRIAGYTETGVEVMLRFRSGTANMSLFGSRN